MSDRKIYYKYITCVFLFFSILFMACYSNEKKRNINNERNDSKTLNAFARFIAGIEYDKEMIQNDFSSLWHEHANNVKNDFDYLQNKALNSLDTFIAVHIQGVFDKEKLLLYPFSGPDYLFAEHFLPEHKSLILVGLEPVGTIPLLSELSFDETAHYLNKLRFSLFTPYKYGFYFTRGMQEDFSDVLMDGTIHHILFFLAMKGYEIIDLKGFTHDINGKKVFMPFHEATNAFMITYSDSDKQNIRELSYYKTDLSNFGMKKFNKNFIKYLKNNAPFNVFIKAASYCFHQDVFSQTRDLLLHNAEFIIQDDSGIRYNNFDTLLWDVLLYGNYSHLYAIDDVLFQEDLYEAYKNLSYKHYLPFTIGYNVTEGENNLMVFQRKKIKNIDIEIHEK